MGQDKLIPPLAPEAAGIITGSEQILKDYASASSLTARDHLGTWRMRISRISRISQDKSG